MGATGRNINSDMNQRIHGTRLPNLSNSDFSSNNGASGRPENPFDTRTVQKKAFTKLAGMFYDLLDSSEKGQQQSWDFVDTELENEDEDDDDDDDSDSEPSEDPNLSQFSNSNSFVQENLSQKSMFQSRENLTSLPKVGIFWDIENCSLPQGKSGLHFVKRIRDNFCEDHEEETFLVACDTRKQNSSLMTELENSLVSVEHVNSSSKNAADECLRRKIRIFADKNSPPAKIVLITGDINFNSELHYIRYKRHISTVLIHNKQTSEALKLCALQSISFEEFFSGLPDRLESVDDSLFFLVVSNLPEQIEHWKIKSRLQRLCAATGGKVLRISSSPRIATIQFVGKANATRASSNLQGEDVYGKKINVRFKDESDGKNNKKAEEKDKKNQTDACNIFQVHFCVKGVLKYEEMIEILKNNSIYPYKLKIKHRKKGTSYFTLRSSSLNAAKKLVTRLNNVNDVKFYDIAIRSCKKSEKTNREKQNQAKRNESDEELLKKFQNSFTNLHLKKLSLLKNKLKQLDKASNTEKEIAVVRKRIALLNKMEKEFNEASGRIVSSTKDDFEQRKGKLMVECFNLQKAAPIYGHRKEILDSFSRNRLTILAGNPGCGKSTQVVHFFCQSFSDTFKRLVVTMPSKNLACQVGEIVSSQLKSLLGQTVGFSLKSQENIVYLSDQELLNECETNKKLDGISHVVVDEVQEETLATEMLISYLKMILSEGAKFHVLFICTNDYSQKLTKFFNESHLISIDHPFYPVVEVWRPFQNNYIKESVTVAIQIIDSNDPGDILVFLPNTAEVIHASNLFQKTIDKKRNVKVYKIGLHTNWKEFYCRTQNPEVRNVVFVTGELTYFVNFPGIRFVIDCGLITKRHSGMNYTFLETNYVTRKVSAIRAAKAGIDACGTCVLLYPIGKSGLFETGDNRNALLVLQSLKLGRDPYVFNYLHPLKYDEIKSTVNELQKIDAVDKIITQKGILLSSLPLEIHLGQFLLETVVKGVGFLGLVFCCIASAMVVQPRFSPEVQSPPIKPILTLMKEFIDWKDKNGAERQKLYKKGVDFELMATVNEKMHEIHEILKSKSINFKLSYKRNDLEEEINNLVKLCWPNNQCQKIDNLENLFLWSSRMTSVAILKTLQSNISSNNVIFETFWKTISGSFIANIIPLNHPPKVKENSNVHVELGKKIIEKKEHSKNLIQILEEHKTKQTVPNFAKEEIDIEKEKMLKEAWEFCICEKTGVRIVWGVGAIVNYLLLPNEFVSIRVFTSQNLNNDVVIEKFKMFGHILHHSVKENNKKKQFTIMYDDPKSAVKAISTKIPEMVALPRVMNSKKKNYPEFLTFQVFWIRRPNFGTAVVTVADVSCWDTLLEKLENEKKSNNILMNLGVKIDENNKRVLLYKLDRNISKRQLEFALRNVFQDLGLKILRIDMSQACKFSSSDVDLQGLADKLNNLHPLNEFHTTFKIEKPKDEDDTWECSMKCDKAFQLYKKIKNLRLELDGCLLNFEPTFCWTLNCSKELHDRLQQEESEKTKFVNVLHEENEGFDKFALKFEGNRVDDVISSYQKLIKKIEQIEIDSSRRDLSQKFNSSEEFGWTSIQKIIEDEDYLKLRKNENLSCGKVKTDFKQCLQNETDLKNIEEIFNLDNDKGFIRQLFKCYGPKLRKLKEIIGCKEIKVDLISKKLIIRSDGNTENILKNIFLSIKNEKSMSVNQILDSSKSTLCPVCLDDVSNAENFYQLKFCDHAYCLPCIRALIVNEIPPITCLQCGQPIIFRDLLALQKECPLFVKEVAKKAAAFYVNEKSDDFWCCPFPGCDGVLRKNSSMNRCWKCLNKFCFKCNTLFHYGQTCEEFLQNKEKKAKSKERRKFLKTKDIVQNTNSAVDEKQDDSSMSFGFATPECKSGFTDSERDPVKSQTGARSKLAISFSNTPFLPAFKDKME